MYNVAQYFDTCTRGSVVRNATSYNYLYLESNKTANGGILNWTSFHTKKKVDLTNYSKLKVLATATASDSRGTMSLHACITSVIPEGDRTKISYDIYATGICERQTNHEASINISSVTGEKYITVFQYDYQDPTTGICAVTGKFYIYKVWLE